MRAMSAFAAGAFLLAGCAGNRELPAERRTLAAVMPFSYESGPPEHAAAVRGLGDAFTSALVRTGRLRLLERQRVDALLQEARFGQTGAVDAATAARIGRQLGAQAVVLGSVASLSVREEGRSVHFAEKTDRWAEIEVEARLVDVESGEVLAAGRASNKVHSAEKHAFGGQIGELATPQALVQQVLAGAARELAEDLARSIPPRPAR